MEFQIIAQIGMLSNILIFYQKEKKKDYLSHGKSRFRKREKQKIYRRIPNGDSLRAGKRFSVRDGWVGSGSDLHCLETSGKTE